VRLIILVTASLLGINVLPKTLAKMYTQSAAQLGTYLYTGFAFGLGLLISGMANPAKVQAFFAISLDPFDLSAWDPSLTLVIVFGILPNILINSLRGFQLPPNYTGQFTLSTKTLKDVDAQFVLGAIVFGISWGLTGVCPGPAVLRAVSQPIWGFLWLTGFWLGGLGV